MEDYLQILCRSRLFEGVSAQNAQAMLGCLGARRSGFHRDEAILTAGQFTDAFGLILSGSALVTQEDYWGNRSILSRVEPGDLFAESFAAQPSAPLSVSIWAESDGELLFLNLRRVLTTCSNACAFHSRLIENLLAELAVRNQRLTEKIAHMSKRSTRQKLLSYLSAQAQHARAAEFDIPFNRQQLADYLCVDRSALSAELSRLQDEGLLSFRRNHFALADAYDSGDGA